MNDPPEDTNEQRNDRCNHPTVKFVASSSKETLLLTRRGEVLVYRRPQPNFDAQQKLWSDSYSDNANAIVGKLSISCHDNSETFCNDREGLCDCDESTNKDVLTSRRSSKTHSKSAELQYSASTSCIINSMEQYDLERNLTTAHQNHDLDMCASSEEVDETLDILDVYDVMLNQDYLSRGSSSPTPVASFDYYGYEPPTPEPIRLRDRYFFPNGSTNDSYTSVDRNSRTHQNETESSGCVAPPLPAVSCDSCALPGFPKFLHHLSHIRITNLSAHPRGNHVLLVSEEGLLFSYGSNEFGQLGLGSRPMKTPVTSTNGVQCYHPHPTIVTPLLENGGKTINCAAGIDYSLVVVKTEGSRQKMLHQQSKRQERSSNRIDECDAYHQMYGFGNNNGRKLGLLDPDRSSRRGNKSLRSNADVNTTVTPSNCVFLPRRVALHCRVIQQKRLSPILPPYGIFSIAASIDDSAALLRRPSGVIELFTWGRAVSIPTKNDVEINDNLRSKPTPQLARGEVLNELSGGTSFDPINQVMPFPQSNSALCNKLMRHVHTTQYTYTKCHRCWH
ncbi:hypothetical protein ACHAXA_007202 [Cyclostephanos tholiformis]|uniref:Uncharacterized protein n=1 Tax=Cyclostephanos tholiformis TaxID=382380 RepID=A0ABD3SG39_9STRA